MLQNHHHLVVGDPLVSQILLTIEETSLYHYRFLATPIPEAKANIKLTVVSDLYTPRSGTTRVANVAKVLKILFQHSINCLDAIRQRNKSRWRTVQCSNSEGMEHFSISDSSESQDRTMVDLISYLCDQLEFTNTTNQQSLWYESYLEHLLLRKMVELSFQLWIESMQSCISSMLFFNSIGDTRLENTLAPRKFTCGQLDKQFTRYQQTGTKSEFYFEPVEQLDTTMVDHVKGVSFILESC